MAMFDLEKAGDLELSDCKSTSETLVKSTGEIGDIKAERCEAGIDKKPVLSRFGRVKIFLTNNLTALVISVIAGFLVLVLWDLWK